MKKTRTLNGKTILVHRNDGLRKRCDCARRAWSTCSHPWHFSFKRKGGKHYRFTIDRFATEPITTRDKARTEADRLRALIRSGWDPTAPVVAPVVTTVAELTFEQFSTKWRENARHHVKDQQRAVDSSLCKRLCAAAVAPGETLGAMPIGLVTEDALEVAFGSFASLAASTSNKYRQCLLSMQKWGRRKGYLDRAWLSEDTTITRKKGARRERRLVADVVDAKGKLTQPGEERRLLATASPWLWRLIVAALETAARRGELLKLQWLDVDLTRGRLRVRAENAKTNEARFIPISTRLRAVLDLIRNDPDGKEHPPHAFVFGDAVGGFVADPKKAWSGCCTRAGILDLHFHDLRHEAASRLLERGMPLQHVQALLGHADAATTSIYLNATFDQLAASMKRTESLHPLAHTPNEEPTPLGNESDDSARNVLVN